MDKPFSTYCTATPFPKKRKEKRSFKRKKCCRKWKISLNGNLWIPLACNAGEIWLSEKYHKTHFCQKQHRIIIIIQIYVYFRENLILVWSWFVDMTDSYIWNGCALELVFFTFVRILNFTFLSYDKIEYMVFLCTFLISSPVIQTYQYFNQVYQCFYIFLELWWLICAH